MQLYTSKHLYEEEFFLCVRKKRERENRSTRLSKFFLAFITSHWPLDDAKLHKRAQYFYSFLKLKHCLEFPARSSKIRKFRSIHWPNGVWKNRFLRFLASRGPATTKSKHFRNKMELIFSSKNEGLALEKCLLVKYTFACLFLNSWYKLTSLWEAYALRFDICGARLARAAKQFVCK